MPGEPEAVDQATQARFAREAREAEEARLRREWAQAKERIFGATRQFRAAGVADRRVLSGVKAVERATHAVDRHVGL